MSTAEIKRQTLPFYNLPELPQIKCYRKTVCILDETTKYPTGVKEKLTFSRSFHPDKTISLETMTKETLNANGQPANGVGDTTEVHYSDMANGHEVLVTKLNGVENYRR